MVAAKSWSWTDYARERFPDMDQLQRNRMDDLQPLLASMSLSQVLCTSAPWVMLSLAPCLPHEDALHEGRAPFLEHSRVQPTSREDKSAGKRVLFNTAPHTELLTPQAAVAMLFDTVPTLLLGLPATLGALQSGFSIITRGMERELGGTLPEALPFTLALLSLSALLAGSGSLVSAEHSGTEEQVRARTLEAVLLRAIGTRLLSLAVGPVRPVCGNVLMGHFLDWESSVADVVVWLCNLAGGGDGAVQRRPLLPRHVAGGPRGGGARVQERRAGVAHAAAQRQPPLRLLAGRPGGHMLWPLSLSPNPNLGRCDETVVVRAHLQGCMPRCHVHMWPAVQISFHPVVVTRCLS
jgi:hypothetical protein